MTMTASPRAWSIPAESADSLPKLRLRSITPTRSSMACSDSIASNVSSTLPSFT